MPAVLGVWAMPEVLDVWAVLAVDSDEGNRSDPEWAAVPRDVWLCEAGQWETGGFPYHC